MMSEVSLLFFGLTIVSAVYWLGAIVVAGRFGRRRVHPTGFSPPVTVLKPLCGDDRHLYDTLQSFCEQDYPAFQVIFGVRDRKDPAARVVQRLIREFPNCDLQLIVSDRLIGANLKVSNLSNLCRWAKYDTLVLADSDMRVGPDYLRAVVAPLQDRTVGLVTCLYRGIARGGLWSTLGSMFINEWFFPSALVAARLGPLRHAFGATIACRRDTLASIGGFEALADFLADDYMLGRLVSQQGFRIALSSYVVKNVVVAKDLRGLFFHELRWTRTFRTVRPIPYFLSFVTYGIPLSFFFLVSSGLSRLAVGAFAGHLVLRYGTHVFFHRTLRLSVPWYSAWLVPLRDVLSFILWALSFLGQSVRWNSHRFRVQTDGRLRPAVTVGPALPAGGSAEPVSLGLKWEERTMSATHGSHLRTLFLHPPSYEGFDGGAGSRYQARREIRSFWYPTWLAQPAALVPGSRLIDAPPDDRTLEDILPLAREYELAVLHTSTPSFPYDVKVAEALKAENPNLRIGFVGAHVAVNPEGALRSSEAIEFVARNEFDFTIQEVAQGRPLHTIFGLSFRQNGTIRHMPDRPVLEDMDSLPFVVDVYKRDLTVENYFIGYLLHPYVSLYTGRGCRSKCTFCLWPQTVGGHRYRTRSVEHVVSEIALATRYFSQVKEYFFDDDTFTDDLPRAEAIARGLGKLGVMWSCNAKANVPYETLKLLKDNGLRLLLVGYESGNQKILNNIKKGIRLDVARQFTKHAKELGIKIHGTFIMGLPGETPETIQETIRFAQDIDPDTLQVSIAAPYPGTALFRQALESGWLTGSSLVDDRGTQASVLSYPHLSNTVIMQSMDEFYRRFYFRPRKIFAIVKKMVVDSNVMRRRLGEGVQFLQFLASRRRLCNETLSAPQTALKQASSAPSATANSLPVVGDQ